MVYEINIYGDIVPFKWLNDGSEYDLKDLKDSLDKLEINEGEELTVNIHTFGGDTTTAFGMYNLLKRFKNERKISIRTRVDGYCASSGVILLLAGDKNKRVGSKYLKPFVHNAWTWMFMGDKKDAQKVYEELDTVDGEIAELYSEETSITKELALQFMNESRNLTIEECKKYGFYTEVENVHVIENSMIFNSIISRNQHNRKLTKNNMSNKSKNKKGLLQEIKNLIGIYSGEGNNNKIVYTAEMNELDFYELEENETPSVGDKATYDGKPAGESNNGEYVLQSGETYKFTGEELTEIIPKEEESGASDLQTENENLKKEIENLKKENSGLKTENKKQKETITGQNTKIETANKLIDKFNSLDIEEEDEEEEPEKPRNHRHNSSDVPVRNLFQNIK